MKGLDIEECRRLKRQQLRKDLRNSIWNCTPSPTPGGNESDCQESKESNSSKSRRSRTSSKGMSSSSSSSSSRRRRRRRKRGSADGSDSDVEESKKHILNELKMDDETSEKVVNFKEFIIEERKNVEMDSDLPVGPLPLPKAEGRISYGGALRPGEGDAIAHYVQEGKRIPRRGEVGLSAVEISKFEDLGYVMSGSRHQRMNAIRIRKENQVYSAKDKRALAMFNYEKAKREQKVMADLQRLVQRHIGEVLSRKL